MCMHRYIDTEMCMYIYSWVYTLLRVRIRERSHEKWVWILGKICRNLERNYKQRVVLLFCGIKGLEEKENGGFQRENGGVLDRQTERKGKGGDE